jgi:WD40 repeat protein
MTGLAALAWLGCGGQPPHTPPARTATAQTGSVAPVPTTGTTKAAADLEPLPDGALLRLGTTRLRRYALEVDFLRGGNVLATAGPNEPLMLWDVASGLPVGSEGAAALDPTDPFSQVLAMLGATSAGVSTMALAPDEDHLAYYTGSEIRVVDTVTGAALQKLDVGRASASDLAFGPGGALYFTLGTDPETTKLFVGSEQRESWGGHPHEVRHLAVTRDGAVVASSSWQGPVLLQSSAGQEVGRIDAKLVDALAFSADGKRLAVVTRYALLVAAVPSGAIEERLKMDEVYASAFSPNGALVWSEEVRSEANSGVQSAIRLRDPDGKLRTLANGADPVNDFAFSADGRYLASASKSGRIGLWELPSGRDMSHPEGHVGPVTTVAASPDGRTIATGGLDGSAFLWDSKTAALRRAVVEQLHGNISAAAFSADGTLVALGMPHGEVRIVRVATGEVLSAHHLYGAAVSLAFVDDDRTVVAAQGNHGRLWGLAVNEKTVRWEHERSVTVGGLVVAPDGKHAVVALEDDHLDVIAVANGETIRTIRCGATGQRGHCNAVYGFSNDGEWLLTSGTTWDRIAWWRWADGAAGGSVDLGKVVYAATFVDDHRFVAGDASGALRLFDIRDPDHPLTLPRPPKVTRGVASFSGGKRFVTVDNAGLGLVWPVPK